RALDGSRRRDSDHKMKEDLSSFHPDDLPGAELSDDRAPLPAAHHGGNALPCFPLLSRIDTWVFDLDNTLYPPACDLWPKIDQRITLFLGALFGLDGMSSRALQKYYYERYGTTLRGLMEDYGVCPDDFLNFTHDIDRSSLLPDIMLAGAISALPGRKL